MKIFVTGVGGQLGYDVVNELTKRNIDVVGSDILDSTNVTCEYKKLDITDYNAVSNVLKEVKPDAVIHCAAWTAVDNAEDENNKKKVYAINVEGTKNIAMVCNDIDAKMIYISTDYIFNGQGEKPWEPDCKSYAPLNYYGETKLGGEIEVAKYVKKFFIVRIAWVFGKNGKNFIKTMLSLSDKGLKELKVVDDQIGTPTYTFDLSKLLCDMVVTEKYGYYHATNEGGYISWADFAEEIFKMAKRDMKINRVSTAEYGVSVAKRPFNSRLDKSKLVKNGFTPLPNWKDAVKRYLIDLGEYHE